MDLLSANSRFRACCLESRFSLLKSYSLLGFDFYAWMSMHGITRKPLLRAFFQENSMSGISRIV